MTPKVPPGLDNSRKNVTRAIGSFVRAAARVEGVVRVSVYGSYVRGVMLPDSDVDLMVVVAGSHRDAARRRDPLFTMVFDVLLSHRVEISLRVIDEARFREMRRSAVPFWKNFRRDEVVLWPKMERRSRKAA